MGLQGLPGAPGADGQKGNILTIYSYFIHSHRSKSLNI